MNIHELGYTECCNTGNIDVGSCYTMLPWQAARYLSRTCLGFLRHKVLLQPITCWESPGRPPVKEIMPVDKQINKYI